MLFVLSTGRAGSRTLANVLSQSSEIVCTHEPLPRLVEACAEYRYGTVATDELAEILKESRPTTVGDRRYGESANRLSLAVPVLATTFPSAQFLWLVRDGRGFVASGMQRGWYADAADTIWERARLRADRLGEVTESDWESWSPFRRVCWLWRRTNEIIRDDLAALDPRRSKLIRLETLEADLGDIAEFLEIEPVDWVVGQHNARSVGAAGPVPSVNNVETLITHEDWSDEEHATFEQECGALMDDLYPGWRLGPIAASAGTDGSTVDKDRSSDEDLAAIRTELADLRVLHAELKALGLYVERVDRRHRSAVVERDQIVRQDKAARKKSQSELDEMRRKLDEAIADKASVMADVARAESLHREMAEVRASHEVDLEAAREGEQNALLKIAEMKASPTYRVAASIAAVLHFPRRAVSQLARSPRVIVKRAAKWAAAKPGLVKFATRLPSPITSRLVPLVSGSPAASPGRTTTQGGKSNTSAIRPTHRPQLGLRATIDSELEGSVWDLALDAHSASEAIADELTHLDLSLASRAGGPLSSLTSAFPDLVHVVVKGRPAPFAPGLSPRGFSRSHDGAFLSIATKPGSPAIDAGVPGRRVSTRALADLPDPLRDPLGFGEEVQRSMGLLDSSVLHPDAATRASVLLSVSAVGLPIVLLDTDGLDALVPPAVLDAWVAGDARELTRDLDRERRSFLQRSATHDHGSTRAIIDGLLTEAGRPGLRLPSMSLLVASNRPDLATHWSRQIGAQDHPEFEVVWAQHGSGFTPEHEAAARESLGDRLQVVSVPSEHTLGDALNAATDRASGDVLVKWDDDDLYGPGHLRDLARTRHYSGAEVVGKAAEFVYLAGSDITIRRHENSLESFSTTIGGPTLTIGRGDLRSIGGWRRTRRRVDSLLIQDVRAAGGSSYRTCGFGFIMYRTASSGHAHTWSVGDEYFLRQSVDQRTGLDLDFASVSLPSGLVEALA